MVRERIPPHVIEQVRWQRFNRRKLMGSQLDRLVVDRVVRCLAFVHVVLFVPLAVLRSIAPQLVMFGVMCHLPRVLVDVVNASRVVYLCPVVILVDVVGVLLVESFVVIDEVVGPPLVELTPSPLGGWTEFIVTRIKGGQCSVTK